MVAIRPSVGGSVRGAVDGSRAAAVCATAGLWLILFWFQLTESVFSLKKTRNVSTWIEKAVNQITQTASKARLPHLHDGGWEVQESLSVPFFSGF